MEKKFSAHLDRNWNRFLYMIGVFVFGTPNSTPRSGCHGAFRLFMLNHIDSTRMVPIVSDVAGVL